MNFCIVLKRATDGGRTWSQYYQGKFMKTDCTFVDYDKKVTVQPDVIDEYNDVLAGLEKEYNLITLAPTIQRITINKRPLIQIYVPAIRSFPVFWAVRIGSKTQTPRPTKTH